MPEYTYLIVGGGMAADAAVKGIRQVDSSGTIGVITSERNPPYDHPPVVEGVVEGRTPPDDYAAGDVANLFNTALGTHTRVEHEDNANMMGEIAGKNMAGVPTPYRISIPTSLRLVTRR